MVDGCTELSNSARRAVRIDAPKHHVNHCDELRKHQRLLVGDLLAVTTTSNQYSKPLSCRNPEMQLSQPPVKSRLHAKT